VYLIQVLLNLIYPIAKRSSKPLPTIGKGWDANTLWYVQDFQAWAVRQKKPDGIVSPPPVTISNRIALIRKFTIAHLIRSARMALELGGSSEGLVDYLKAKHPFLNGPLSRIRKGTHFTSPYIGVHEDARSGGNPGIASGRAC